jgi:hypothetical protein
LRPITIGVNNSATSCGQARSFDQVLTNSRTGIANALPQRTRNDQRTCSRLDTNGQRPICDHSDDVYEDDTTEPIASWVDLLRVKVDHSLSQQKNKAQQLRLTADKFTLDLVASGFAHDTGCEKGHIDIGEQVLNDSMLDVEDVKSPEYPDVSPQFRNHDAAGPNNNTPNTSAYAYG